MRDLPPKPDLKTQPIEAVRWHHTYHPGIPAHLRKNKEEIDLICEQLEEKIATGKRVWSEEEKNWVEPE